MVRAGAKPMREAEPGFFWGAFADLREGLERLVLVNLVWSLTLVPGLASLAFPGLPLTLRSVLVFGSAVAAVPATLVVYGLVKDFLEGDDVRFETVRGAAVRYSRSSFQTLAPLLVGLGLLGWTAAQPLPYAAAAAVRLFLLLTLMTAIYWGPLLAADPKHSPLTLLRASSRLVLDRPWPSLGLAAASLVCVGVAIISIGGFFLVSLTLLALFQTRLYRTLTVRRG